MRFFKLTQVNLALVAILFALGACAAKAPRSADSHYDLSVNVPATTYGTEASVMLRRVDIRGIQSGRSLIQIIGDNPIKYQEERGHFWHIAAPTLLERAISDAFAASSQDASFGTNANMQDADYRYSIDVRLFAYKPGGDAMISFNAVAQDRKGAIVLAADYEGRAPLKGTKASDAVNAFGVALSDALTQLSSDLAKAL